MKKLTLLIVTFLAILSVRSQNIVNRSNGVVTVLDSNLFAGKAFRVPAFQDTATANLYKTLDSAGKLIYTYDVNSLWFRTVEKRWRLIGNTDTVPQTIINYIDSSIAINNFYNGVDSGTRLISGNVLWDSNFVFENTALVYQILGTAYTAPPSSFTSNGSDSTFDRYIIVVGDTLGNVFLREGTAANPADIPTVDPESEILLAVYFIPALSTQPATLENLVIYKEGNPPTEWDTSGTATGLDFKYNINPYEGLYSTKVSSIVNSEYIEYYQPGMFSSNTYSYLSLRLRLTSAFSTETRLVFTWYNGTSAVSIPFTLFNNTYGYDRTVIGAYQTISIPLTSFSYISAFFDKLRISFSGDNPDVVQIDNVLLQTGGVNIVNNISNIDTSNFLHKSDTIDMRVRLQAGDNITLNGAYPDITINSLKSIGAVVYPIRADSISRDTSLVYLDSLFLDTFRNKLDNIAVRNDSLFEYRHGDSTFVSTFGTTSQFITWSVLDSLSTPAVSPTDGDKYLVGTSPTGAFVGQANNIATWDSTSAIYIFESPSTGDLLYNAGLDVVDKWNGANWIRITIPVTTNWSTNLNFITSGNSIFGTVNNRSVGFYRNNVLRMVMDSLGGFRFRDSLIMDAINPLATGESDSRFLKFVGKGATGNFQSGNIYYDAFGGSTGGALVFTNDNGYMKFNSSVNPEYQFLGAARLGSSTSADLFNRSATQGNAISNDTRMTSGNLLKIRNYSITNYRDYLNVGYDGRIVIQDSISSAAAASSILDVRSTSKGLLVPRMTAAQRIAISSPATGLMVFDTDTASHFQYTGSAWENMRGTGGVGATVTASNGLTKVVNDIQLGGTLTKNDTLEVSTGNILLSGNRVVSNSGLLDIKNSNTGSGRGLYVTTAGTGIGIQSTANTGIAISATTTNNIAVNGSVSFSGSSGVGGSFTGKVGMKTSSDSIGVMAKAAIAKAGIGFTNTVGYPLDVLLNYSDNNSDSFIYIKPLMKLRNQVSIGNTGNGGGGSSIDFLLNGFSSNSDFLSNQIISRWISPMGVTNSTRTSQFQLTGVNNAITDTILTINGDGTVKFNKYTGSTFQTVDTTTYKPLVIDGSGNIKSSTVWQTGSGGGGEGINIYNTDSSLSGNRTVDLNGNILNFIDIAAPAQPFISIQPSSVSAGFDGTIPAYLNIRASDTAINLFASHFLLNSPTSGSSTDSVLTWDAATKEVRVRDASTFGISVAQLTDTFTTREARYKFRNDTTGNVGWTPLWRLYKVSDSAQTNIDLKSPIASPTFTGTVTIPTPFTLGATSVTSTGTQLNYLSAATGTTGTTSTNLVYSTSPTLVTPTLGVATGTSLAMGESLEASSVLDVASTTKGILIPRMTASQRNAISSPATQLLVSNSDTKTLDQYNGTSWNTIAGDYNRELLALQALGSPIKANPVVPLTTLTSNTALTDGRCTWTAVYVDKEISITGVAYFMGTQGSFTGDQYNGVGLYSYSGGTLTLVDTSTRDENIWKATTGTWNQKAFAGGARTIQPGIYFILSLYNSSAQTTAPTLAVVNGNTTNISILTTNSAKLFSFTSSINTPAATQAMSGTTAGTYYALSLY